MHSERKKIQIELLKNDLKVFEKANFYLKYSHKRASLIDLKKPLNHDDLELFDSLASRFMRSYEVLKNQVLRTMLILLEEKAETMLDRMNLADKLELITSAKELDDVRITRNKIAHEYLEKEWLPIYQDLLDQTSALVKCEQMILKVAKDRKFIIKAE